MEWSGVEDSRLQKVCNVGLERFMLVLLSERTVVACK